MFTEAKHSADACRKEMEALANFVLSDNTDVFDVAAVATLLKEEDKQIFTRSFDLHSCTIDQCIDMFRFTAEEILRLCNCLRMPHTMTAANGTYAPGIEVLCIVLRRLAYPCRYVDLEEMFDRPQIEICLLFNAGIFYIDDNYRDRLTNPNQPWLTPQKLEEYSAAVHAKGAPLTNCWGFIDGTVRGMCRPSQHQREVYNGHKRVHGLKFHSVVTPNGLIANLWGPMPGRRHDSAMLNASGLLEYMEEHFNTPGGEPLCVYGDPAYPLRPHIQRPHRGRNLTLQQQQFNTDMSKVRQAVEWQFGKLVTLFAFLDFKKNLKLFKSPVARLYRVAALLTNCHGCLNGNQTSVYFNLQPPVFEEYVY